MNSNQTLPETLTAILSHYGMILCETKENTREYLAPEDLARTLHIPDYGKLGFSYETSQEKTIAAFYDSEFFKTLEQFLCDKGRIAQAAYPSIPVNTARISPIIAQTIGFSNAAVRLKTEETKTIHYFLIFFKYLAFSDDQQEGFLPVLVNTVNSSVCFLPKNRIDDIWKNLRDLREQPFVPEANMIQRLISASGAAQTAARDQVKDFQKGIEKRLNRDIKRVCEYYETLREETAKLMEKAQRASDNKDKDRMSGKLQAIEAEQKWKMRDIISKYSMTIAVQPVSLIRIETQSTFFWLEIKRRVNLRSLALTWNPLLKQLDSISCEGCFFPGGNYSVCDAHLHILCERCCKICSQCGKKYCVVCCQNICTHCHLKSPVVSYTAFDKP